MASKIKFVGEFNFKHQMSIMYCAAYTERQAWLVFCRRIAKKHDIGLPHVMGLFDGSIGNYKIEKEKKDG